jgi:glycosyltransferase involved in cell wall biosynthesis
MDRSGRPRVAIVAQAAPAQGGIPTFVDTILRDPVLSAEFDLRLVNTTREAVREAGSWSGSNARHAVEDALRVFRAAREADVVHVQTALLPTPPLARALALCGAARAAGAAVLCHAHTGLANQGPGETFAPTGSQRRLLGRFGFVDAMLTVSDAGARGLRPYVGGARVEIVDNAVDVGSFERADVRRDPAAVLFVGTLAERKGLLDLLAAVRILGEPEPNGWRLEVVGAGNEAGDREAERVAAAYRAAGLGASLLGPRWGGELRVRLRAASVFCLPSHLEGQPIGILEAMASGLPVVATRIGGIPDQVRDGVDGFLVDRGDVEGLAGALGRLLGSADLRAELGASGRRRAEERFDLGSFRERLAGLYRAAARRSPRARGDQASGGSRRSAPRSAG